MEDSLPLVEQDHASDPSNGKPVQAAAMQRAYYLKWVSLVLLIVQNSGLFVVTRYSRTERPPDGAMYLGTVVVLLVEWAKLAFCLL